MGRLIPASAAIALAIAAVLGLGGCASCSRELKPIGSNVSGGLDRTVTLYDYQDDVLGSWSGRFDVSDDDNEVFFDDAEGKRVIIQGGIVVCEEN